MSTSTKILAVLLALALLGDVLLARAYLAQRDKAVTYQVTERHATGTAIECSKGTEAMAGAAQAQQAAAASLVAAADDQANKRQRKAQQILATPAGSADVCTAAQARVDAWASERGLR